MSKQESNLLKFVHPECNLNATLFEKPKFEQLVKTWDYKCRGQVSCEFNYDLIKANITGKC